MENTTIIIRHREKIGENEYGEPEYSITEETVRAFVNPAGTMADVTLVEPGYTINDYFIIYLDPNISIDENDEVVLSDGTECVVRKVVHVDHPIKPLKRVVVRGK